MAATRGVAEARQFAWLRPALAGQGAEHRAPRQGAHHGRAGTAVYRQRSPEASRPSRLASAYGDASAEFAAVRPARRSTVRATDQAIVASAQANAPDGGVEVAGVPSSGPPFF